MPLRGVTFDDDRNVAAPFGHALTDSASLPRSVMLAENFDTNLRALTERVPFKPFTVELVSGATFTVDHPEALIHRSGAAVYMAANGKITLFDQEGVSRLHEGSDLTPGTNGH